MYELFLRNSFLLEGISEYRYGVADGRVLACDDPATRSSANLPQKPIHRGGPSYAFELSSYTMEDYIIREVTLEEAFAESVWR